MREVVVSVVMMLVGCGQGVATHPGDDDDTGGGPHGGPGVGGDAGGSGNDASDPDAVEVSATCPLPVLLVAVEALEQEHVGGRVARFAFTANGAVARCTDITAGGLLQNQPLAVTWVPPHHVAVATRDAVDLVDVTTDEHEWAELFQSDRLPIDAFVLDDDDGPEFIAVALPTMTSTWDVRDVYFHSIEDGHVVQVWSAPSSVPSVTRDPRDPRKLLAARRGFVAAAGVDIWNDAWDSQPYVRDSGSLAFRSIYAAATEQGVRIGWSGDRPGAGPEGVLVFNGPGNGSGTDFTAVGPRDPCPEHECEYLQVVPDPSDGDRWFALCNHTQMEARSILRFQTSGGTCTTVFSDQELPGRARLARLAVGP